MMRVPRICIFALAAAGALPFQPCLAQMPVSAPRTDLWTTDGNVRFGAAVGQTLYFAGSFGQVSAYASSFAVLDPATGGLIRGFPWTDGTVRVITPDGSGGWFIGGSFTTVGGLSRAGLARIRGDGTVDPWHPNFSGQAQAIAVNGDAVYVGSPIGLFGYRASTGQPLPVNFLVNGTVSALLVDSGRLYVGGSFASVLGAARQSIAAIQIGGNTLDAWNPGIAGTVSALAASGGVVYAGGAFTMASGVARSNLAGISASTAAATPLNHSFNGPVYAFRIVDQTLYTGGGFILVDGQAHNRTVAVNLTTGAVLPWFAPAAPGINTPPSEVDSIEISGGRVLLAGLFSNVSNATRLNVASVDPITGGADPWNPRVAGGETPVVRAISVGPAGIAIGGDFQAIGGVARPGAAAMDLSSGELLPWAPNGFTLPSGTPTVTALAADAAAVYLDGLTPQLSKFDPQTGVIDQDFVAAIGPTTGPVTLRGDVLCAANGQITRLDRVTGDIIWNAPVSSNIRSVVISDALQTVFSTDGHNIRGFDIATGASRSWNIPTNNDVRALAVDGQRLYIGGSFGTVGPFVRDGVAALEFTNPESPVLSTWAPAVSGSSRSIASIAVRNSIVYLEGSFDTIGGEPRPSLAAINPSSALACAWTQARVVTSASRICAVSPALVIISGLTEYGGRRIPGPAVYPFRSCIADFNGDCLFNVNDFIAFQNAYAAGDPAVNCDGSSLPPILNINDFFCFMNQYAGGCP